MIDRLIISADNSGAYEWIDGLTIRTFHGFCYSTLRNYGVNEFDNKFKIIGDENRAEDEELSKHVILTKTILPMQSQKPFYHDRTMKDQGSRIEDLGS